MKTLIIVLLISMVLYACSRSPQLKPNRTANTYFNQLDSIEVTTEQDAKSKFEVIFSDFKTGATESNIRSIYADKLYFNDTLRIVEDIDELVTYMTESAESVDGTTVEVLEVIRGNDDYYLRWSMKMDLDIKGTKSHSHSVGMSQVRFDENGKINFQQDFWDSSEAFFEYVPVLGRFVKKVKSVL